MSMTLLNKTFIEKVDTHRRHFFWHVKKLKKGYNMIKWSRVFRSRNKGGLGIKNMQRQNISTGDIPNGYTSDIVLNQQARVAHRWWSGT
jgi:hypothetical protein